MASISDISNSSLSAYRTPAARMRDLLLETAHLSTTVEEGRDCLAAWLKGHDLPAVDAGQEPVVWLFRGLAALDEFDRPEVRQRLVSWTVSLVSSVESSTFDSRTLSSSTLISKPADPSSETTGSTDAASTSTTAPQASARLTALHHDRFVYNLFRLCAGLAEPDAFAAPIRRIFEQGSLSGDYQGIDHRSGLRAALVFNQIDASLEHIWMAMVRCDAACELPGRPYQGFEGLLWMPDPERGRGHLALEPVLGALSVEIARLSDKLKRRDRLRTWFEAAARIHADIAGELDVVWIRAARERSWPRWAVESMPMGARLQSLVAAG